MRPFRLLALDLDGTVLGPSLLPSERTRAAIRAARDRGVLVVIATGRMYQSTVRHVRALDLPGPLICYQGADVREMPGPDGRPGALLRHLTLPASVAREAVAWAREHGLGPHVNTDDRLIMEVGDREADEYELGSSVIPNLVPDLMAAITVPVTKVLAVGRPGLPEGLLAAGRERFAGRAEVTVSHPQYLEFMAPGAHKGAALTWLAARLRIPMAETMAIGDQHNDLEMLRSAGIGVAMGGAPAAVVAAADRVTAPVEEDGAALAIEALILADPGPRVH